MYFLLDDDIQRIRRKRLAEEIKTTGGRETERERERKKNKKVEKREREDECERASERTKLRKTLNLGKLQSPRVRLPSKTRFIPQLLRASIRSVYTNTKRHQYDEANTNA